VRQSTIYKHSVAGGEVGYAHLLGAEIKRRRVQLGLSQRALGEPLSRSFVSLVEHGRLTPSLPSLVMMATRLGTSAAGILTSVESQLEDRLAG
jgi:transcriptional regulator with XRE-family HTH domain